MKFMTVWYVIHYYCRNNKNYTSITQSLFFSYTKKFKKPVNKILDNKSPFIIPNKDAIKTDMVNFAPKYK